MTFTTKPTAVSATATYEDINAAYEQGKFVRYQNARRVVSYLFDHTNGSSPTVVNGYSERLSGGGNEVYGVAKSIGVLPGDTIQAKVYAKYVDTNPANRTAALNTLLGQIASAQAGVVIDGTGYSSSTSSFPFAGMLNTSGSTGGPKAYLNWLVFDRNYVMLTGGYVRLSAAPKENGSDVAHELLSSPLIAITQPGYVYIYLSNEETNPVEVYFDDFQVTQTSAVVQSDDYYPFGLTFNSYQRENGVPQNYLYNGKELLRDLGLNWDDFGARMYMPETGRWGVLDPLSEISRRWSLYSYAYCNPIRYIDIDGMVPGDLYTENGEKIGTDRKNDGKTFVVSDKKVVQELKKSGGVVSNAGDIKSAQLLPSAKLTSAITKAVDRSNLPNTQRTDEFKGNDDEGKFHEEGGRYGQDIDGHETVTEAKPGDKADPTSGENASVDIANPANPANDNLETVSGGYHIHPAGQRNPPPNSLGSSAYFEQTPTKPIDYDIAKKYSGNSYVIGAGNKTVYIINGSSNKPVASFPLKVLQNIYK